MENISKQFSSTRGNLMSKHFDLMFVFVNPKQGLTQTFMSSGLVIWWSYNIFSGPDNNNTCKS